MALIDDFKDRFPELDETTIDQYIPILENVWPCYYGGSYEGCGVEIILNLLAHLMVVESGGGSGGGIGAMQSKTVGSVSVSYATMAPANTRDAWLMSTKYGMMYLQLTRNNIGGFFV